MLPTDSMDKHPAFAQLGSSAKGLEAAIVQGLVQNSNCGWFLMLGSFRAKENGNGKPKENGEFGNLISPPPAPYPPFQHPVS